MNKEANMKTVLEIAQTCGATITHEGSTDKDGKFTPLVMLIPDQLAATIEAWNKQNSERIYQIKYRPSENWQEVNDLTYLHGTDGLPRRVLFTAPPQTQSVRDALEMAAKVCDDMADVAENKYDLSKDAYYAGSTDGLNNASEQILALIDQPAEQSSECVLTLIDDEENRTYKFSSQENALIAQREWLEQGIKSTIQPQPPVSQELINKLEEIIDGMKTKATNNHVIKDTTMYKFADELEQAILQSKPAKG